MDVAVDSVEGKGEDRPAVGGGEGGAGVGGVGDEELVWIGEEIQELNTRAGV